MLDLTLRWVALEHLPCRRLWRWACPREGNGLETFLINEALGVPRGTTSASPVAMHRLSPSRNFSKSRDLAIDHRFAGHEGWRRIGLRDRMRV